MSQFGFWTELSGVKLDDAEEMTSTFQAMPYGEYQHPIYGKIDLNEKKARDIASNVNAGVRGTDLDIDYDHKMHNGKAAGWIKRAEARASGLFLTVKWTKNAWEAIKAGEYKYFSPEYQDAWKHPKTGIVHKNVLFGGGITNRPFLKDILPLNLSELFAEQAKEGTGMDSKKLRQLLGLSEDATDEQVEAALVERPKEEVIKEKEEESLVTIAASETLPKEVIELAEKSPAIKALVESVTLLQNTVGQQGVALKLAETAVAVQKLAEPINGKALPAATQTSLQSLMVKLPKELSDEVVALFTDLNKSGYVQLGEISNSGDHSTEDGQGAAKRFNDKVDALMKSDDKLTYSDAVMSVSLAEPDLFQSYRESTYIFKA
jgi:phage I-like protein